MDNSTLPQNSANDKKEKPVGAAKAIFEWLELFVFSFAMVLIIMTCICRHSPVDGESMRETLQDKDVLIISDLFYTPSNGDIVVFQNEATGYAKPYVKRVIATEGQTVDIDITATTQKVTVDGKEPEYEKNAAYIGMPSNITSGTYTVPEGCVFVMGDNRYNSKDSRMIGFVDVRSILGHVVWRVYPFNKMGTVS